MAPSRFFFGPVATILLIAGIAAGGCATAVRTGSEGVGGSGGSAQEASSSASKASSSAMSSSSSGVPGSCTMAAECAGLNDTCNIGACINGMCAKMPTNDFGACDDKKFCTDNDTCMNGMCVGGSAHVCQSSDSCHVASCDDAQNMCVEVAGNDGAQCQPMDPCSQTGACQGGVCGQGIPVDCSFFDDQCNVGKCDPVNGCVAVPRADGTGCDDGLFCTIGDTCTNGKCGGLPNQCAPPGTPCQVGVCNEAMKTCSPAPAPDGSACQSGNICLGSETCLGGVCQGGVPANNGKACKDGNNCDVGTTCLNGKCGNPTMVISQCIDNDTCCPPGCMGPTDSDCAPLSKPAYSASLVFTDKLPGTTMTITWDGTSYWSTSGGGPGGDRLAQYDAAGNWIKNYQPNIDFRAVFTQDGKGATVYERGFSASNVEVMTQPGVFGGGLNLNGGQLDAQSSVCMGKNGEYVAMISGAVTRWSAGGAFLQTFNLSGYGVMDPNENQYPQNRGIAVAGGYYLTYYNQLLSAWDASGNRVGKTTLTGAGTSFDSHFSLSYANHMVFIVDQAMGSWRGYDVGL